MKTVAILGLGAMGKRMASNYIEAGYTVHLWNRGTVPQIDTLLDKGAKLFSSPKECVKNVDIVLSMLRDDTASKDVWLNNNGAIHGLSTHTIAIECSTISLNWSRELHQIFKEKNLSLLDAPVLGSLPQVEAKQLIHLIGGDKEVLNNDVREFLSVSASNIHYVGDATYGTIFKLIANGIFGMQVTALSETLNVLKKCDIHKKEAIEVLNQLPITSPALKGIGMLISNDNHQPLFPIDLVEKDFHYLKELANQEDQHSIIHLNHSLYYKAKKEGYAQDNISGISQLYNI